jgi:WD40 repeat protein
VFNGHEGFVWKVLALNDGKVISVGSDRTLRVWDVYEKKCLSVVEAHYADVTCLTLLKDGKVISGSVDGVMKMWGL